MSDKISEDVVVKALGPMSPQEESRARDQKVIADEFARVARRVKNPQAVIEHVSGFAKGLTSEKSTQEENKK